MKMICPRCKGEMFNFEEWFYKLHKDKLICKKCTNKLLTVTRRGEELIVEEIVIEEPCQPTQSVDVVG